MLTIRRLGRRSFEVFRQGSPIGIVRFMRSSKMWNFRPYPTLGDCDGLIERSDKGTSQSIMSRRRALYGRSNRSSLTIDLLKGLRHTIAAFCKGALVGFAFRQVL